MHAAARRSSCRAGAQLARLVGHDLELRHVLDVAAPPNVASVNLRRRAAAGSADQDA